jgi:hypothetical protein
MLRMVDSFDHYGGVALANKYTYAASSSYLSIAAGQGRRGAALSMTGGHGVLQKFFNNQAVWIVGLALKMTALPTVAVPLISLIDLNVAAFVSAVAIQTALYVSTTGALYAARGGTTLGTTSGTVAAGAWNYIEIKVTLSGGAGTVDVQVNGVNQLSLAGQNTITSANAYAQVVQIGNNGDVPDQYLDDLYIADGAAGVVDNFLGNVSVACILPSGSGALSQFTNSIGNSTNNYSYVNEQLEDGDATYVDDATVGQRDTYAITLPYTPTSIYGLQVNLTARADSVGLRSTAPVIYRGGTPYDGTGQWLPATYSDLMQVYEDDPVTSAAWTAANIAASQFGVKVVA